MLAGKKGRTQHLRIRVGKGHHINARLSTVLDDFFDCSFCHDLDDCSFRHCKHDGLGQGLTDLGRGKGRSLGGKWGGIWEGCNCFL